MGQMGATGFAQIATELGEDETIEGHDLFLSQLAHSLVSLSEAQADRMDQLLSQIDESDEQPDQVMAQISEESDKNLVHLGQMLSQLKEEDMDKIVTMLDGMDFAEVGSEN